MKLIVGLGNVGSRYHQTRHNAGFMLADTLARAVGAEYRQKAEFNAYVAEINVNGEKLIIAKPTTMMNLSGRAVKPLVDYYKLTAADIIIAYDDLDLAFGEIKLAHANTPREHNGVSSVLASDIEAFWSLRVGIDIQPRPIPVPADFVLSNFSRDEREQLSSRLDTVANELLKMLPEITDKKF